MTALAATAAAFLLVVVLAESLGRRRSTQSSLGRHLLVNAAAGGLWSGVARSIGLADPLAVALFWSGALLLWLGVRAHLESSILLTMAERLAESGAASGAELRALAEARSAPPLRLLELERGGFLRRAGDALVLTPRGRAVVSAHRLLTGAWSSPAGVGPPPRGDLRP